MAYDAARLLRTLHAAGYAVVDVQIGSLGDRLTWTVTPVDMQATAQPLIDTFDADDPAVVQAELEEQVKREVDHERLISAVVWTIIDTYSAPATLAKYQNARSRIIAAFKAQPWKGA